MRLERSVTTHPVLFSMVAQSAEIQIVSTSRGIVIDVQATNIATDGHPCPCHAVAKLALDEAVRLETLLGSAVSAVWDADELPTERTDPRQTALWSNASFTIPIRSRRAA